MLLKCFIILSYRNPEAELQGKITLHDVILKEYIKLSFLHSKITKIFKYLKTLTLYCYCRKLFQVYTANADVDTVVPIHLHVPVTAKILRINPTACNVYCAMRFEVVGCYGVNECAAKENPCDDHAVCSDFADGFKCTCKPGYIGNGFQCTGM